MHNDAVVHHPVAIDQMIGFHGNVSRSVVQTQARLVFHVAFQLGVTLREWSLGDVDFLQQFVLPEGLAQPLLPERVGPGGRPQGETALDEDVVCHDVVVTAVIEHRPKTAGRGLVKDIAVYDLSAVAIVEINRATAVGHLAADLVPVVVSNDCAAIRGVTPHVQGAAVVGARADMVHVVELEQVIVAGHENCLVRRVVDFVMGDVNTNAGHDNIVSSGAHTFGDAVDVVVRNAMPGWGEGLAVAAADAQPAGTVVVDIATLHGVVGSPFDDRTDEASVANRAARKGHAFTPLHREGIACAVLEGDASELEVGSAVRGD